LLPKALRTGWGVLRKSAVEADEKPKKTGMLAEISGGKGSRFQNFKTGALRTLGHPSDSKFSIA
jgi:hypothetical protein